jgi:hypothetical protein
MTGTLKTTLIQNPSSADVNITLGTSGDVTFVKNPVVTSIGTLAPIVSATAQASTSGTSIDFTSIPSYVKRITVMIQGLSFAGASGQGRVQIGTGGVLATTGYASDNMNVSGVNTCSVGGFTNGLAVFNGNLAADTLWGVTTITNVSGNTWIATFNSSRSDNASARSGTGFITLGGALNIVSVVATVGAFDAGTINIMYE